MTQGGPAPSERFRDVVGFVLAGGRSSRMGRDKALVELGGLSLIEWSRSILAGAGFDVWVAGARNSELGAFAPLIADEWEGVGPLGGVCSALRQIDRAWSVFVTVDQPLLAPAVLKVLLEHARTTEAPVTVASLRGEAQTFPAVVRRDALPILERELDAGRRGCMAGFRAAGVRVVPSEEIADPEELPLVERWFWNVNTPEDLARVEAVLGRADWESS